MAQQTDSGLMIVAAGALAAAAYYWFVMRPAQTLAPGVPTPGVVVDGSGQALPPAAGAGSIFDPNSTAYFQAPAPSLPSGAVQSVPVGTIFGAGTLRVKSLGTGGMTFLERGDVNLFAPKGTVVENLRDGSTYTLG